MSISPAGMALAGNALRAGFKGLQLHTADPGTGGINSRSSAPAQTPAWSTVDPAGNFGLAAPVAFTGTTPNGPITWVSVWSSTTLGSAIWYGNFAITGDLTADANGNYTLTALNITGTAT